MPSKLSKTAFVASNMSTMDITLYSLPSCIFLNTGISFYLAAMSHKYVKTQCKVLVILLSYIAT